MLPCCRCRDRAVHPPRPSARVQEFDDSASLRCLQGLYAFQSFVLLPRCVCCRQLSFGHLCGAKWLRIIFLGFAMSKRKCNTGLLGQSLFFSLNGLESARSRPRCHGELLQSRFCVFGGFDIAFAPGRAAMLLRTIAWTCSNLYCLNSYSFRAVFLLCEHSFRPFAAAAADSQCSRSCVAANLFLPR